MSDAGNIITAVTADVVAAVPGVTVGLDPINVDNLVTIDLPHCILLLTGYSVETVGWGQEERTWTIKGTLIVKGGTREAMQLLLDAIRDQVFADKTLDGSVHKSVCTPLVPYSQVDSERVTGEFAVLATKTV